MRAASCRVQPKGGDVCETSESGTSDQVVWLQPNSGLEVTRKGAGVNAGPDRSRATSPPWHEYYHIGVDVQERR